MQVGRLQEQAGGSIRGQAGVVARRGQAGRGGPGRPLGRGIDVTVRAATGIIPGSMPPDARDPARFITVRSHLRDRMRAAAVRDGARRGEMAPVLAKDALAPRGPQLGLHPRPGAAGRRVRGSVAALP